MIVLHGALRTDGLWLWGERPAREAARPPRRRPRAASVATAATSPFDPGPSALLDSLSAAGTRRPRRTQPAIGWLPTVGLAPVASSPLIGEPPPGALALAPWRLTVCPLGLPAAIDVLCACVGKEALAQGVFVGRD